MESKGYGFHHALPTGDDDMGIFGDGKACFKTISIFKSDNSTYQRFILLY